MLLMVFINKKQVNNYELLQQIIFINFQPIFLFLPQQSTLPKYNFMLQQQCTYFTTLLFFSSFHIYITQSSLFSMSQEKINNLIGSYLTPFVKKAHSKRKDDRQNYNPNDLQFSIDTIIFRYRGNHSQSLYNRELRIKNKTGARIFFKIKSNNPQSYEVLPFEEYLDEGKSLEIRFKLNVTGTNIHKYNVDRFRVQWGCFDESEGKLILTNSFILKVRMETETATSERQEEEFFQEKQTSDQEKVFKDMLEKNLKEISKTNEKIQQLQKNLDDDFHLTRTFFILAGIISLLLGFLVS